MSKEHIYNIDLKWTGNLGDGTRNYAGYSRAHEISIVAEGLKISNLRFFRAPLPKGCDCPV